jgi:hypothetical protein
LPPCDYPTHETLGAAIDAGALSRLQLEGVAYACRKHLERLPDGVHRAGFMIGDGAGVGKGRQISGVVLDNFARGRKRHVWVSSSRDLKRDAERDLADLGCAGLRVIDGVQELERETRAVGLSRSCAEGVLFVTYSALVSKKSGPGGKTRLEQICEWFAGDTNGSETRRDARTTDELRLERERDASGCLIFDECHKAKNHVAGAETGSRVASCVIELQRRLPNARVVYCSATGVSEVGNMAYMARLGFWGRGTPFHDAKAFIDAMKHRGVGFLEMLAMEMKASGKYVSRGLSFRQAEFHTVEAALDPKQRAAYDACADFVAKLKACLSQALTETRSGQTRAGATWKAYWAMHQRLFKLLCVSAKVPEVVRHAKAALARGQCVVVGMQTTGESAEACEAENAAIAAGAPGHGPVPAFVSTTRAMLRAFVETHFPTHIVDVAARNDAFPEANGSEATNGALTGTGRVSDAARETLSSRGVPLRPHPECVEAKGILLDLIDGLDLPPNALDELIDELGGPTQVAEMTGRRWRVVRRGGRLRRELRVKTDSSFSSSADSADGVNIAEKRLFQSGEKLVAVISDAASTGISLHARAGEGNRRRRVHVTIELPWSADKAIQQLGRTHRSNQTSGPSYVMVSTNLGGERRFAAAVARRLQSLGALTRGDRRAATGVDLSEGNLDSPLGRQALKKMYDALVLRGAGKQGLANGVPLESVLAHLPTRAENGEIEFSENENGDAAPDASAYLFAEATEPGAGIAALHDELRACVVSLGLQVGLSPVGLTDQQRATLAETGAGTRDAADVRRFLNRVLGLPTRAQNLLFGYFIEVLGAETRVAKAEGRHTEGVSDLSGSSVVIETSEVLVRDPFSLDSGSELRKTTVAIDRGVSFAEARRALREHARLFGGLRPRDGFYRMRREMYGRPQVILALTKPGTRNTFAVTRPNTGASFFEMELEDLDAKYVKLEVDVSFAEASDAERASDASEDDEGGDDDERGERRKKPEGGSSRLPRDAASDDDDSRDDDSRNDDSRRSNDAFEKQEDALRSAWTETFAMTEFGCMHGRACVANSACRIGTRKVRCCVVSGAVVPSWGVLEKVLEKHALRFPRSDRGMRAARVVAEDGTKVVGIRYPEELLEEVRDKLFQEWAARDDAERRRNGDDGTGETLGDDDAKRLSPEWKNTNALRRAADEVTPVDARCARRAATAPKTMRSFFDAGTHAPEFDIADPVLGLAEREARTKRAKGEESLSRKKTRLEGSSFFAPRAPSRQRQTCPICMHVFPASSLNTDVNAHVDKCVERAGS